MNNMSRSIACYHLPGLFEFYELYRVFLPLYRSRREYFYDRCDIGSACAGGDLSGQYAGAVLKNGKVEE